LTSSVLLSRAELGEEPGEDGGIGVDRVQPRSRALLGLCRKLEGFVPSALAHQAVAVEEIVDRLEEEAEVGAEGAPGSLLVDRHLGARRHWIVPIDECYALVGLIRTRWRGLTGGSEVWKELARFYEGLDRRARPASATDERR